MLLIDDARYSLWIPESEEQFENMIKEHAKEIFGEDSLYFGIKQKIVSRTGIGSIPDGYLIRFSPLEWYLVEAELSSHSHEHVVMQLNRFMRGIRNFESQREIVEAMYNEIKSNPSMRETIRIKSNSDDPHHFLSNTISRPPRILIAIEQEDPAIQEACEDLKVVPQIIVFQTLVKEGAGIQNHAHLFEPLYSETLPPTGEGESRKPAFLAHKVITPIQQDYLAFFQGVTARFKERVPTAQPAPKPRYYCQIPTGIGSVHFEWLFVGNPRNSLGVELHLEKGDKEANLRLLREMLRSKKDIEEKTGEQVFFQENWGKINARLYLRKAERDLTEDLKKWAVEKMEILYNLLQPRLQTSK